MVDGKWRTVGFKALFRAAVGMSKLYNGILAERARCRPGRTAPHVHRRHRRRELRHAGPARKKRPRRGATWRVVAQGAARPHMMPVPPQRNGPRFQLEASAGSVSDPRCCSAPGPRRPCGLIEIDEKQRTTVAGSSPSHTSASSSTEWLRCYRPRTWTTHRPSQQRRDRPWLTSSLPPDKALSCCRRWSRVESAQHPGSLRGCPLRTATQTDDRLAGHRAGAPNGTSAIRPGAWPPLLGVDQRVTEIAARSANSSTTSLVSASPPTAPPEHPTSPKPIWPATSSQPSASGYSHRSRGAQRKTRKPLTWLSGPLAVCADSYGSSSQVWERGREIAGSYTRT